MTLIFKIKRQLKFLGKLEKRVLGEFNTHRTYTKKDRQMETAITYRKSLGE